MGWIKNLRGRLGGIIAGASFNEIMNNPMYWGLGGSAGRRTSSGENIGPISSYGLAAYYACIHVISEDCGKLPWGVFRHRPSGRGIDAVKDTSTYQILHNRFSDEVSSQKGREELVQNALGWGGGIAEIQRTNGGTPLAMHPIEPNRVTIKRDENGVLFYHIRPETPGGEVVKLSQSDVFHTIGFGGIESGLPLSSIAMEAIGKGIAAQRFGASLFGNGLNTNIAITSAAGLDDEQFQHVTESLSKYTGSAGKAFNPLLLDGALEVKPMSIPPADAQWIESQQFTVEEVCRYARVNPNKVQHWLRTTFNNVAEANIDHVNDTLMPWFRRLECEANFKLFTARERAQGFFTKINADALLRGDIEKRSAFLQMKLNNGMMTFNEARELEDMNPRAGGDTYMVPENMRMIDGVKGEEIPRVESGAGDPGPPPTTQDDDRPGGDDDAEFNPIWSDRMETIRDSHIAIFADLIAKAFRVQDGTAWQKKRKQLDDDEFATWWDEWIPKHVQQTQESLHAAVHSLAGLVDTMNGGLVSVIALTESDSALNGWLEVYQAYSLGNGEGVPKSQDMAERLADMVINAVAPLRRAA